MNKNYRLKTNEAKSIQDLAYSIDEVFYQLKQKSNRGISSDDEYLWKQLFNEKVVVHIDNFLKEIADDTQIEYKTQSFIQDIKEFV